MTMLWEDLKLAARLLRRSPGFFAAAAGTLGLGVALVTVMFSAVDRVLLRPLPFSDPGRIVAIRQFDRARPDEEGGGVAIPAFLAWRSRARSFSGLAAMQGYGFDLTVGGVPETVDAWLVTEDYFRVLGVTAWRGRVLIPDDFAPGRDDVVVLSHGIWTRRFGADPALVGGTLLLDGAPRVVVGVMPESFAVPGGGEFWAPRVFDSRESGDWGEDHYQVIGRLAPGSDIHGAQAELGRITGSLAADHPLAAQTGVGVRSLMDATVGNARPVLIALLAAVAAVLLIACVNVANLLLARSARRGQELAVRGALGASPWRLARQLFGETVLIALAGGMLGVLLAAWGADAAGALAPAGFVPRAERIAVDGRALVFALAVAIGSALCCGAIPAFRAARPDLRGGMHEGGRASTGTSGLRRTRSALIAAQVALALMLLVGATLLTRSLAQLLRQDPGFEASGRVALQLFIWDRYDTAEKRARFLQEAGARLSAVPGVRSVGAVSALPYAKAWIAMEDPFTIEGAAAPRTGEEPTAFTTLATPGYFTAAGIPLRRGRFFREGDDAASAPVVLVNEALARRWLQDGDPIGRRITVGVAGAPVTREIVGIVGDVRQSGLEHEPSPELFVPHAQSGFGSMTFVVDGGPGAAALLPSLRAAIWELRPDLPIYDTATLTDLLQGTVAARRFVTVLLVAFACVALVLASVGIYGVISFVTGQRLREFGIRLALGASPGSVVRQTVGGSVRVVAVGILVGLAGTAALTALLRRFLFGITPADPVTYITLVPLVLGIAAFASYLPARRAGRVDPMVVLRAE